MLALRIGNAPSYWFSILFLSRSALSWSKKNARRRRERNLPNGKLRNVPEKGLYNWEPGAFFGIYRPDTFWFE